MNKLEYLNSPNQLIKNALHDWFCKQFTFEFKTPRLLSKKAKPKSKTLETIRFQTELFNALNTVNKRMYRSDVFLEILISVDQSNAPQINKIPKFYIDLLWRPDESFKRKYGILKDDDQIRYLRVRYKKSAEPGSSIKFTFQPYKSFLQLIELIFRCELGRWEYGYSSSIDRHDRYEEDEEEKYIDSQSMYNLTDYLRDEKRHNETYGENASETYKKSLLAEAQKTYLKNARIKHKQLLDIFKPIVGVHNVSISESEKELLDPFMKELASIDFEKFDSYFFNLKSSVKVDGLPVVSGDSKEFKNKLIKSVEDYVEKEWYLVPLLNPVGITIFILPPSNGDKDFDNIAIDIISLLIKKLEPPTNSEKAIKRMYKGSSEFKSWGYDANIPDVGITSYQVLLMPRKKEDIAEGYIKVNIFEDSYTQSFTSYLISTLGKYSDQLEDAY